jgi:hypothetical protein
MKQKKPRIECDIKSNGKVLDELQKQISQKIHKEGLGRKLFVGVSCQSRNIRINYNTLVFNGNDAFQPSQFIEIEDMHGETNSSLQVDIELVCYISRSV